MELTRDADMQIIVDCQILQTSNRFRGMGQYLANLLAHLDPSIASWVFVLNDRFPALSAEDEALLKRFGGEIAVGSFKTGDDAMMYTAAARQNQVVLDRLLAPWLTDQPPGRKSVFFNPAQFADGLTYPAYPSQGAAKVVLFYDLIPYLYQQQYHPQVKGRWAREYAQRFRGLYDADHIVTISQTSADDLSVHLGIDPSRVSVILGAGARRSQLTPVKPAVLEGISEFILMPSGEDFRKNNERATAAVAAADVPTALVVTSRFSPGAQKRLQELYPWIVFTGVISDEEFLWLYQNAQLVLFPTEYEGLGMPILEAVDAGATVACSRIPVFAEISDQAFHFFDPHSRQSITDTVRRVLDGTDRPAPDRDEVYREILERFSWETTARLFEAALDECEPTGPRPRLAVCCPSPASYSAVGKFAMQLHGELSRHYDVHYYAEAGTTRFRPTRLNILQHATTYRPASQLHDRTGEYDRVLYHLGNSEFHLETILEALRTPGVAIVHDTHLDLIFAQMVADGRMPAQRRDLEQRIEKGLGVTRSHSFASVATNQRALVCHSAFAVAAGEELPTRETVVHELHLPVGVPRVTVPNTGQVTVSFAGIIHQDKGVHILDEISDLEDVRLRMFGFDIGGGARSLLRALSNVELMSNLTDKQFEDALRETDVLVNYRANYRGESSLSTLEAMRGGAAVVVRRTGWFDELPDEVVFKVDEMDEVPGAVRQLVEDHERRAEIGRRARAFLAENYSFKKYAEELAELIEGGVTRTAGRPAPVRRTG